MYRLYQHKSKDKDTYIIILARVRSEKEKFMCGICLGSTMENMEKYKTGYFSDRWGTRLFKPFDGVVEMKSQNNLFKSTNSDSIFIKSEDDLWEISDNRLTKSDIESHSNILNRIDRFRIKNR